MIDATSALKDMLGCLKTTFNLDLIHLVMDAKSSLLNQNNGKVSL
jgi:hypothetical protein